MAPLAVPLLLAGTGIAVAGQIQAGRAAEAQGRSEQNMAEFNAKVQEQEAKALRQRAGFAQQRQVRKGARIKSALTAQLGFAGGLGSPVAGDLTAEQAAELELENLLIGFEGETAARRAESQAELDRFGGRIARRRGKNLKTASLFQAGSTLLTGFGGAFAENG